MASDPKYSGDAVIRRITEDPNASYQASVILVPAQSTRDLEQTFEVRSTGRLRAPDDDKAVSPMNATSGGC